MEFGVNEFETYQMRCGETYFTTKGRFIFHCTICEKIFDGFNFFELHIKEQHIETGNTVDQNEDIAEDYDRSFVEDDVFDSKPTLIKEHMTSSFADEPTLNMGEEDNSQSYMEREDDLIEYVEEFKEDGDRFEVYEEKPYDINKTEERLENVDDIQNSNIKAENFTGKNKSKKTKRNQQKYTIEQNVSSVVRKVRKRVYYRPLISEEERKHHCPVCGAGFKDRYNMLHHLKRHTDNKDHKCPECSKVFYTKSEVRIHLLIHNSERQYLCNECGKTFVSEYQLRIHIKRHQNQRDYECEVCNKAFFTKGSWEEHSRIHTAERPYSCKICSASFPRRNAFAYHLKTHENKKEFECDFCVSRFNQKANLISHIKTVHTVKKNLKI